MINLLLCLKFSRFLRVRLVYKGESINQRVDSQDSFNNKGSWEVPRWTAHKCRHWMEGKGGRRIEWRSIRVYWNTRVNADKQEKGHSPQQWGRTSGSGLFSAVKLLQFPSLSRMGEKWVSVLFWLSLSSLNRILSQGLQDKWGGTKTAKWEFIFGWTLFMGKEGYEWKIVCYMWSICNCKKILQCGKIDFHASGVSCGFLAWNMRPVRVVHVVDLKGVILDIHVPSISDGLFW